MQTSVSSQTPQASQDAVSPLSSQETASSSSSQATSSSKAPSSSQATSRYDGPESEGEETASGSDGEETASVSSSGSRKRARAAQVSEPREKRARRDAPPEWAARVNQLERRIGQVERYELEASRAHYRIMAAEARVRVGAREFLDTVARVKNASEDLQTAESRMSIAESRMSVAEMHAHNWKSEIKRYAKSAEAYVAEINEAAILIEAARPDPARCWRRALGPMGFPMLVGGFTAVIAACTGCANPASAAAQMASASVLLGWYPRY